MELVIKWQGTNGTWNDFNANDVLHMPVNHTCHLFSNTKIPVIVKQDDFYVVNTEDLKDRYRKTGKPVFTFQTILTGGSVGLDRPLSEQGFMVRVI